MNQCKSNLNMKNVVVRSIVCKSWVNISGIQCKLFSENEIFEDHLSEYISVYEEQFDDALNHFCLLPIFENITCEMNILKKKEE